MTSTRTPDATGLVRHDHADGTPRSYTASAVFDGVVWACGQVPRRQDGSIPETIGEQVAATVDNLEAVLVQAGSSLAHVLKLVLLTFLWVAGW